MRKILLSGIVVSLAALLAACGVADTSASARGRPDRAKPGMTTQPRPKPTPGPVIRKGPVAVRLRERGALLIEPFDGEQIDRKKWRIWTQNPEAVKLSIEDGRFVIRGRGRLGHNGLWSLNAVKFKDVTLVARMGIRSEGPRPHELLLHLCGGDMPRSPDHWVEIAMRHLGGDRAQFSVFAAVEKGLYDQSGRKLNLRIGRQAGFLARISLDGGSNLSSLEVRDADGKWRRIVEPLPLHLRTTHCEIKMRRSWGGDGDGPTTSTGWFDDVRIYPRAASNPVLVRLVRPNGRPIYMRRGDSWPPRIRVSGQKPRTLEDLVVELWTADGKTRICAVQSAHFAHYMLPLKTAPWDVYPVPAKLRVTLDGKSLGEVDIPCKGLAGLYPDDVYDIVVD